MSQGAQSVFVPAYKKGLKALDGEQLLTANFPPCSLMLAPWMPDKGLASFSLGFGCLGLNIGFGPATERTEAVRLIRAEFDRGVTFFDTAAGYGAANEEMLGEAVAPFRGKVVVASKFGFNESGYTAGMNSRPERIRLVAEQSCKRLKTDVINPQSLDYLMD